MCEKIVIDEDTMHWYVKLLRDKKVDHLIYNWIRKGHGIPCFTFHGKYGKKINRTIQFKELLLQERLKGRALIIERDSVYDAEDRLAKYKTRYNVSDHDDDHVVEFSIACRAKILCAIDGELQDRFKNIVPKIVNSTKKNFKVYPLNANPATKKRFLDRNICKSKT